MHDDELLRYSRQIMLPEIDIDGQTRLVDSHVLIIGLGGLGSPAAMYLAAAGVGTLALCDDDAVDLSNLQRQIAHTTSRIGSTKTSSAASTLRALNPTIETLEIPQRLEGAALDAAVAAADVVLDCCDNFSTRFAVNAACRRQATPLVSGAAVRWDGQVSVFSHRPGSACYRCLYDENGQEDMRCSHNGVIAPLVGVIGAIQALETLKVLTDAGETLDGRLLVLDGMRMKWRELRLQQDPACPVCGK